MFTKTTKIQTKEGSITQKTRAKYGEKKPPLPPGDNKTASTFAQQPVAARSGFFINGPGTILKAAGQPFGKGLSP